MSAGSSQSARLIAATDFGAETRLLEFESDRELGFRGGQYIIVNTGIALPGGKSVKRAYSILSADGDQRRIQLAVRRIDAGRGSDFMHRLQAGARIAFSGPWGKVQARADDPAESWVIATDTGITAALGLVRGREFRSRTARLAWFPCAEAPFLPEEWVGRQLGPDLVWSCLPLPLPGTAARRVEWDAALQCLPWSEWMSRLGTIFLFGDGDLLLPLRERLLAGGRSPETVRLETFFHHAPKSAGMP